MSNHVLIRLIRFVSRFTVHLCNTIYFSIIFSTSCKQFIKILYFIFTVSKHGLNNRALRGLLARDATAMMASQAATHMPSLWYVFSPADKRRFFPIRLFSPFYFYFYLFYVASAIICFLFRFSLFTFYYMLKFSLTTYL